MAEGRIRRLSIVKERKGGHGLGSLGRTDSTAIWFIQCVGCEYRLIDYLNPLGLPFTTIEVLLEKRLQNRWPYGAHFASKANGSEKSRVET
jgi:hypothetical protein